MTTYTYIEDSGHHEQLDAPDDAAARATAERMLREGDWGTPTKTIAVAAHIERNDGESSDDIQRVEVLIEPLEPACTNDEHDWIDGDPRGSDHGGVAYTDTCSHCGRRRRTDTGDTNPANGTQMETTEYLDAADTDEVYA